MKILALFISLIIGADGLDVASLHPLITDALKQVGGNLSLIHI